MDAFKTDRELSYEKPPSDALSDIEKAFIMIGKVQQLDRQAYTIQGKTKCGLQTVYINARVEVIDGKTKVLFHGKSDDFGAVGAQKGIDNLINTMQNLDNTAYVPSKTAGISPVWVIALILEITFFLIIIFGLRSGSFETDFLIVLIVIWASLFTYLVVSRLKASKNK